MRRPLTIVLAALLASPFLPADFGTLGIAPAIADDDDGKGRLRIPKFRQVRPPSIPRIPSLPRIPRGTPPVAPAVVPAVPAIVPASAPDRRPGEVVVAAISAEVLDRILADGFTLVASTARGAEVIARLRVPPGVDPEGAQTRIQAIEPEALVDLNYLYRPIEMPCRDGLCPAFEMVGWAVPPGHCGVATTIGMIDTTVNVDHEALRDQAVEVISLVEKGDRPSSAVHGTAIAALIVGDEESRTPGLLPASRLIAVEAFHRDAGGDAADVYSIVRGIDALVARGVRVVNLSFAGPPNLLLERSVAAALESGAILVAAAGNQGPKAGPAYPGAFDGVVAVTAVDSVNRIYRNAGQGGHIAFAAPGVNLWTAASVSGGRYRSGTSYAAPFVTAAIAATMTLKPAADLAALTGELAAGSIDLGDQGRDPVYGWGLVRTPVCGVPDRLDAGPQASR